MPSRLSVDGVKTNLKQVVVNYSEVLSPRAFIRVTVEVIRRRKVPQDLCHRVSEPF